MKSQFIMSVIIVSSGFIASETFAKNKYSECVRACESRYSGKNHDKTTELGACDKGCSLANWVGKERGYNNCETELTTHLLVTRCRAGLSFY